MSTNINITVDNSNLTRAAKLFQETSRQSKQQKESEKILESKIQKERSDNLLASSGQTGQTVQGGQTSTQPNANNNATDRNSFGYFPTQPYRQRRPAANRRGSTTWIFDYSDLREVFLEGNLYEYGTYRNGSRIQNYEFNGSLFAEAESPTLGTDEGGPFLSSPTGILQGTVDVYGPGIAELHTSPDQYLLEKPPNAFNKITVQRRCHTPRPGIPSPSNEAGSERPYVAYRLEEVRLALGEEIASEFSYDLIDCTFTVVRLSNNWTEIDFSYEQGLGDFYSSYEGEYGQDMVLLTIVTDPLSSGSELFLKAPIAFASETYVARIEYNGATGMVRGYINDIEVISCATGEIIGKKRYQVQTSAYSTRDHVGAIFDYDLAESPVGEPPLKLYKVTSTFT
jgi:hypothetical protein